MDNTYLSIFIKDWLDAHEENLSSGVLMKQIHVQRYKAKKVLFWKHWENFKSGWFLEQKYHGNCNARCDCYQTPMLPIETELEYVVRASPWVYVTPDSKIYCEKVKMCRVISPISFSAPNWWRLPWLVKGATKVCTSKKECNKLDLTVAQYCWLVDHNDWPKWFAISSPHICAVPVTVLLVGLPKRKKLNLDI